MIADSPSKHSTIYEILIQTKQKLDSWYSNLVCHHAVYSKELEEALAEGNESRKEFINLIIVYMRCVYL